MASELSASTYADILRGTICTHVAPRTRNERPVIQIKCTTPGCIHTGEVGARTHMPPDIIGKKFGQQGWDVDRKGLKWAYCPDCVRARRNRRTTKQPPPSNVHTLRPIAAAMARASAEKISQSPLANVQEPQAHQPEPSTQEAPVSTNVEPRALSAGQYRKVINLLEEHFHDTAGLYATGWSDQRIAEEVDAPRASVAKLREEAFGVLKIDPAVKAELDALQVAINKANDDIAVFSDRSSKHLASLESRVVALKHKLQS